MTREIKLPVRNKKGEVVKKAEAMTPAIYFGTISNLMELLDIDDTTSSMELLKKVSTAWKEIVEILSDVFPEVTDDEWKYIRLNDLVPVVLQVIRYTFSEIMTIPSDSKN